MKISIKAQGARPRKKLIPLSPARKKITFELAPEPVPAYPAHSLGGAVLELSSYYLQFGLSPAQALRSALADIPEAAV